MDSGAWAATAAWVGAGVAGVAVLITWRQAKSASDSAAKAERDRLVAHNRANDIADALLALQRDDRAQEALERVPWDVSPITDSRFTLTNTSGADAYQVLLVFGEAEMRPPEFDLIPVGESRNFMSRSHKSWGSIEKLLVITWHHADGTVAGEWKVPLR